MNRIIKAAIYGAMIAGLAYAIYLNPDGLPIGNLYHNNVSSVADSFLSVLLLAAVGLTIYFVPSIIARKNHKQNETAIFVLNLCLGWTLIGWVVALVWAVTVDDVQRVKA